ncbi:MAG: hypothetical protein IT186_20340 [Acidobacteria bacterium]|nr:hypothetical protein [Acidobacteriota bacterium]MCG3193719.1 hypothetical protein [Thermoanaerobaculia bacterium]MCK6684462.1 hypothetical protein [Thermoanaerobaculia bacterium]
MSRFSVLESSALFSNRMKYDYLFEMEMWLKGIERFFVLDCLPLSPFERTHASLKNFVEELAVVRLGVAHLGLLTTHLLGEGKEDLGSFLVYLESQVARPGEADPQRRRTTAEAEMALAIEKLDDFSRVLDELSRVPFLALQTYLSTGRILISTLKSDSNLGVLFRENLKPVLDRNSKQTFSRVLGNVPEPAQKSTLAALFVQLLRNLRYTEKIKEAIASPASAKRALLVFSLMKSEADSLCRFIRRRLLPRFPENSGMYESLERLVFSTEMEVRKVMELGLVDVALMKDPKLIFSRMEDAAGILKDLFQQNIIGLAETFSTEVDGRALFPDYSTRRDQSLKLREDLWSLIEIVGNFQRDPQKKSLKETLDALDSFRRGSMKFLMFKDWSLFERFHSGFARDRAPRAFLPAANQFEVFLRTLVREVNKRSVLNPPGPKPPDVDTKPIRDVPPPAGEDASR